ncbi:uncharacterized protein DUF2784 [Tamaricihabitans halophyticus]|uniref:Uncharacterized protein DUF2784 n=1 Tax=Tamaricihabitans halophyticus TaxID=1262583 RepID=A0A4R2R5G3_9PSEU|nr:DUF2784 domain-containing protein [Tamaricihabitans halophyticus]TCP57224.1 uncharacterized protein DUF2784 [Tamaricihabitans halophyticus]
MAQTLATLTAAIHFIALAYIGLGGFLAWRWPKSIFVHMFFALWGVLVVTFPLPCPLTSVENYFRQLQGLGDLPGGFNEYYIYGVLFPDRLLPLVAVLAFAILAFSYVGAYLRWRQRRAGANEPGDGMLRPAG